MVDVLEKAKIRAEFLNDIIETIHDLGLEDNPEFIMAVLNGRKEGLEIFIKCMDTEGESK